MEKAILGTIGCNQFFAMLESPKKHGAIQLIAEKFIGLHQADEVSNLTLGQGCSQAVQCLKQAFSCLLVLLMPKPAYMGTSPSSVAYIMNCEPKESETFLAAFKLFLEDNAMWQPKIDEVLAMGTSTMKMGEQLEELTDKMRRLSDDAGFNEHFVEAVTGFKNLQAGLRKGAVDELRELIRKKTQSLVEQLCASENVSEADAAMIQVLMTALDIFPSQDMVKLKQQFLKWQQKVSLLLNTQIVKALTSKIHADMGKEDADLPDDDIAKIVEKFKGQKVLSDAAKESLQELVWAAMMKVHNQELCRHAVMSRH